MHRHSSFPVSAASAGYAAQVFKHRRKEVAVAVNWSEVCSVRMTFGWRKINGMCIASSKVWIGRSRMVTHSPHAVMSTTEPLVCSEDNQRILSVTQFVQSFHDLTDPIVHATHSGSVATNAYRSIDQISVVEEPGVNLFTGKSGQVLVGVVPGMPIQMCFQH